MFEIAAMTSGDCRVKPTSGLRPGRLLPPEVRRNRTNMRSTFGAQLPDRSPMVTSPSCGQQSLRRGTHRSVRDLVASIRTWIERWNDNPSPFVWHKTADEIHTNLAAYCTRISNSGPRTIMGGLWLREEHSSACEACAHALSRSAGVEVAGRHLHRQDRQPRRPLHAIVALRNAWL